MSNRIIINSGRNSGKKSTRNYPDSIGNTRDPHGIRHDVSEDPQRENESKAGSELSEVSGGATGQIPLDEVVWGNDRAVLDKIDKGLLADRRLFVRIRHIQKVSCSIEYRHDSAEPVELDEPLEFMIIDLSVGGIGIICEQELDIGRVLGVHLLLDDIPYDIICEVVYCIRLEDKYRAGLKIVRRDKKFMRHLKIFVARVSLTNEYASGE